MVHQAEGFSERGMSGTAYVSSWIKALENDPTDIRAAAVDAHQMSDWLISAPRPPAGSHWRSRPTRYGSARRAICSTARRDA